MNVTITPHKCFAGKSLLAGFFGWTGNQSQELHSCTMARARWVVRCLLSHFCYAEKL